MTKNTNLSSNSEILKPKRGRKSKKDLIASLNATPFGKNIIDSEPDQEPDQEETLVSLNVAEIEAVTTANGPEDEYNELLITEPASNLTSDEHSDENIKLASEQKPAIKKRGRKPKGGKIIHQVSPNEPLAEDRPNVILHLKCSVKDLMVTSHNNFLLDSYNFGIKNNEYAFELINGSDNNYKQETENVEEDDELYCKDVNKEVSKKLKLLEHNLHINNVNNKKSSCFWDTCEFDNPPIYIPKYFINGVYHVYGCFCSPECGVAYLMNETLDSSTKFERYHLFNHIYSKIYEYNKNIKPAPNPYYMLEKYYGNLSIQEFRSLLRNERLFLIIDKPLTRILPELHEDNDDFILNNKIIPSNYQVKSRLQRKKHNKNDILNEKFGVTSTVNE